MVAFAARRVLVALVTLFAAVSLFFLALSLVPGDPVRALFGPNQPRPEVYAAIQERYHFDQPLWRQYLLYLGDLARGDLGHSFPGDPAGVYAVGPPVTSILAKAVPVSARIVAATVVVQLVLGVALAVITGLSRRRRTQALLAGLALLLVATPVIVVAYGAQGLLPGWISALPTGGIYAGWISYVLPTAVLSLAASAYVFLLTRSSLQATLAQPYIRATRARSLPPLRVVGKHALRPSLLPVIALVAANVGQLVTGLIVVEGIFDIPGVGGTLFSAIVQRDRTLLIALLIVIAALVITANAVADLLYATIDPRIRPT